MAALVSPRVRPAPGDARSGPHRSARPRGGSAANGRHDRGDHGPSRWWRNRSSSRLPQRSDRVRATGTRGPSALIEQARAVLAGNDMGAFVRPGRDLYPHQWNWDSALIAIGLARVDPARGRAEVRSLLRGQWKDGMVPHIVFHVPNPDYSPGPRAVGLRRRATARRTSRRAGSPSRRSSRPPCACSTRPTRTRVPRRGRPGARALARVAACDAHERGGARGDPAPLGGGRQLASLRRGARESGGRRVGRDRAHRSACGRGRRAADEQRLRALPVSRRASPRAWHTAPTRSRASRSSSST